MPLEHDPAQRRLRELEERVLQLQEENEHLAERQADAALLGVVSEHLYLKSDPDGILQVALEQASILKDLPLCAVGALGPGGLALRQAYLARSDASLGGRQLPLPPRVLEELAAGAVLLDEQACAGAGLTAEVLGGFSPRSVLLLPCSCRPLPVGLFLFADDGPGRHLADSAPVLERMVETVSARLENVVLLEELLALNEELDAKVAERTRALTAANEELEREMAERQRAEEELRQAQKLESIGQLAGGLAHDFNNLLTTILGVGELLAAELPPGSGQAADAATILEAGRHAAALTRQLLAFSRKQRLEVRPLRLDEVCRAFSPMLARLIGEEIAVHLDLDLASPPVLADRSQVEQVLMNLAINARDAMPRGGRLTIEVARAAVREARPQGPPPGRWVRLSVVDTGAGMAPGVAARAFEPFFTTKERGKGTGLGLATVYGVVLQHGGHVRLQTAPGQGARFDLYLPEVADGAVADLAASRALPRGGDETVLVVDDEPSIRRVLRAVLARLGYRVLEAAGGAEALETLEAHERAGGRVDLLLSDVVMPGLRGPELAQAFQARRPGRPVVLMSGYAEGQEAVGAVGGPSFLPKPLTPDAVARAVRAALDATPR
jgi:signal transduction histidine kinase/ActR/RegA family two-component response regulator